ncbi:protein prenylyltransferase [Coniochaeta ligniaria NRRL 30616]|uniref:Protein farnesyltransferase/geranylgeranyltransferase type-1 subunit alpha n=1 Tax=Coniochaeta ligniaria NRRL 30616 TaxID=1408157 RepID=A0A1J7IRG7_9PEZI|nr:protein prenylyltransferase [Coniochaeta ligniaria NRRL 30616]
MPPKGKAAAKPKEAATTTSKPTTAPPPPPSPSTVNDRTQQRTQATNPHAATLALTSGLSTLSPADKTLWINSRFARSPALRAKLGTKAQRDLWRHVNEANLPVRSLKPLPPKTPTSIWGIDKTGRDIGTYPIPQFDDFTAKRARLTALIAASHSFASHRRRATLKIPDPLTNEPVLLLEADISAERRRRTEMASLRADLYGTRSSNSKSYASDPEWDDVTPTLLEEPEGATLAAIAYPDDYAEAISYLRAVMVRKEYSPRCLRLTEHVIQLNPAHYTVWLYRASILFALGVKVPEEIQWLNGVALANLKNYQIWHHRHLLVDQYYPVLEGDEKARDDFARGEAEFMTRMLEEDAKNYHVWSYRSYLVRKLGLWKAGGERERRLVEEMVEEDVRNNSAWSHRFFVVFSDPEQSTEGVGATEFDPRVPGEIVDRELGYALGKIGLAPQNQSPWNYLRGALVKGGRKLGSVRGSVEEYVTGLGTEEEEVRSTHALDLLAEIYAEQGETEKADLCLRRLAEKWDPIRAGYWGWRRAMLEQKKDS